MIKLPFRAGLPSLLIATLILCGCSRDPNIRKQKFVAQGDSYFKDGKYPEAQISYSRALQIDPRYVVALYKSAQCSERLGNWNSAYQELLRTVDLEPENWPAQLDLAQISESRQCRHVLAPEAGAGHRGRVVACRHRRQIAGSGAGPATAESQQWGRCV